MLHLPVWSTPKNRVSFIDATCPQKQFIPTILSLKMKMFQHLSSSCDRFCTFLIYMLNSNHLVLLCVSEPGSSPKMSILVHKARRIWIQWDELPVDQQRGFITHYTIYLHILDSNNTEVSGEQWHRVLLCVCLNIAQTAGNKVELFS